MEYTDAPNQETFTHPDTLAGSRLPDGEPIAEEGKASDGVAVLLSVVPGLGHIYKGHRLIGALLIFAGTPIAVLLALLAATGTAGFALLLLPIYWIAVMFHVYSIDDRAAAKATAQMAEGERY